MLSLHLVNVLYRCGVRGPLQPQASPWEVFHSNFCHMAAPCTKDVGWIFTFPRLRNTICGQHFCRGLAASDDLPARSSNSWTKSEATSLGASLQQIRGAFAWKSCGFKGKSLPQFNMFNEDSVCCHPHCKAVWVVTLWHSSCGDQRCYNELQHCWCLSFSRFLFWSKAKKLRPRRTMLTLNAELWPLSCWGSS